MDCHDFETRFEAYLAGELPAKERPACEAHIARCPACRELVELAASSGRAPGAPVAAEELVGSILERTSGPVCGRAGELLAARMDDAKPADELEAGLLELHLAGCEECRSVARVLAALGRDLPGLSEVRPDPLFVDDVLALTLPATVRWRRALSRWWSRRWAAWLRRPRFAWEAAFVLTVACLPVLTSSASPVVPLAETAREVADETLLRELELRVDRNLGQAGRALLGLAPVARADRSYEAVHDAVASLGEGAAEWAGRWADLATNWLGTLRDGAASVLAEAADGEKTPGRPDTTKENDLTHPIQTRAGDGSKGETR